MPDLNLSSQPLAGNLKSQNSNPKTVNGLSDSAQNPSPPASFGKEKELLPPSDKVLIEEIKSDLELTPHLEAAGVEKRSETITVPPDIAKMGVQTVGIAQPVVSTPTVALPLTDDQIELAIHQKIWSNIRWLGEW